MADKPKTVKVEALQYHTYNGKAYQIGDTYEIDEQLADSVQTQGKAVRTDRVAHAKATAAPAKTRSTAVEPMTTTNRSGRALAKPRAKK